MECCQYYSFFFSLIAILTFANVTEIYACVSLAENIFFILLWGWVNMCTGCQLTSVYNSKDNLSLTSAKLPTYQEIRDEKKDSTSVQQELFPLFNQFLWNLSEEVLKSSWFNPFPKIWPILLLIGILFSLNNN